jgi:PAS domain S-box-containing protein
VRLTEAEYRALVEHSPVMIWRSGLDARCDYFNEPWLAFTGRTLEEECGDGWATGVHPDDLQRCVDYYLAHFERREEFEMEYRLRRHDGVYRWILDRGTPVYDDADTFTGFIGSCIDVDDRRLAQAAFENWVLGIVGHDIRNPLGAISQASELIARAPDDPAKILRNAERIDRGVQRIKHIVDDLLDLTRERRGGIPIEREASDLAAICRAVVDELALTTKDRAVHLTCNTDVRGSWDPHRIAQAVSNLVGNAIQHGTPGTAVEIRIASDGDHAIAEVRNQGEIPAERLPRLFEAFQGAAPTTRRSGGLGLGLFISRAIARAHDGTLDVETSPLGTTFRLRIPRGT